ncbi:MAG: DUF4038 domain-containing protein [Bacteroidetes bacterium]|nr:DUF4038 domain-containing protein [Bacteroidota bacterium]
MFLSSPKNILKIFLSFVIILVSSVSMAQYVFPVRISADKRYLQDQRGKPFPILGRTAWCIISQTVQGQHTFIEHTKSFGYNAIEMSAICHWRMGNHAPFNGKGDFPFLKKMDGADWKDSLDYHAGKYSPDFTTPNEAYWKYMDEFIAYCNSNGILIFFFPAYVGYQNSDQGWMEELVANGPDKVKAYGTWIAKRYQHAKNIVWMLLGDDGKFSPQKREAEAALIAGLKSVPDQQSIYYSAESTSGENSADNEFFGKEMTLNGVYNWVNKIPAQGRLAYARQPVMPSYLLEEPYDEEGPDGNNYNPHAIQPVRRFQWWAWLSVIGGYVAGNGYIWPFIDPYWQQHLNSNGAKNMQVLNGFIKSIEWWKLVPSGLDGMKNLVIAGSGADTAADYVASACTRKGDLLVAYIPPANRGKITIDVSVLSAGLTASWFDPTNGQYRSIGGSINPGKGRHDFEIPGANSSGERDWVLVIKKKR